MVNSPYRTPVLPIKSAYLFYLADVEPTKATKKKEYTNNVSWSFAYVRDAVAKKCIHNFRCISNVELLSIVKSKELTWKRNAKRKTSFKQVTVVKRSKRSNYLNKWKWFVSVHELLKTIKATMKSSKASLVRLWSTFVRFQKKNTQLNMSNSHQLLKGYGNTSLPCLDLVNVQQCLSFN